jgi:putative ABC transport system permease protein
MRGFAYRQNKFRRCIVLNKVAFEVNTSDGTAMERTKNSEKQISRMSSRTALWEAFRIAVDSIWAHKMRSILTLIGIIIGVTAVVTIGAAIEGLGNYVSSSLEGVLGSNTFTIRRFGSVRSYEEYQEQIRKTKPIYLIDMKAVMERCGDCYAIAPQMNHSDTVKRGSLFYDSAGLTGTNEDFPKMQDLDLSAGRFISALEVSRGAPVAVIGSKIRDELFGPVDPIGKEIRISGDKFRVIGVEAENGSLMGRSLDTNVYVPYTAFLEKYGTRQSISFKVKSASAENLQYTQDEVRQILRARRKLRPNQDDNFGIFATQEVQDTIDQLVGLITVVIMPVVCISMVVGAIVVMNIMLVVVTERTNEIGMRKSIGARRKDILLQFLVESGLLALIGGVIGILIAYGISTLINLTTSIPMYVTLGYVVVALLASGGIGIVSGIYPAYKAAKLDPIVALTRD